MHFIFYDGDGKGTFSTSRFLMEIWKFQKERERQSDTETQREIERERDWKKNGERKCVLAKFPSQ
jgi:hypothetical protein